MNDPRMTRHQQQSGGRGMLPYEVATLLLMFAIGATASEAGGHDGAKVPSTTWRVVKRGSGSISSEIKGPVIPEVQAKATLERPLEVEIVSQGRVLPRLEEVAARLVEVKVVNRNPYSVIFEGRGGKTLGYVAPVFRWKEWRDGAWAAVGIEWCGTGRERFEIESGGSRVLLIVLADRPGTQQVVSQFYRRDNLTVQSEVVLYEKR